MSDRVVVVTGASAGVGRATARAFARRGDDVALLARGVDGLKAARAEIEAMGRGVIDIPTDVADAEQVEAAADAVERELGPIDVWVNDAMAAVFAEVRNTSPEDFRRVTEVTYLGQVHGTMAALRRMLPRDRGVIVSVGSALAYRSIPLQASYCGAKHAVRGFLASLRTELMHEESRVKVTEVHLPALNTPQFGWVKTALPKHPQPVPPIFQPELAADAIVWAADHPRREFHVGLSTLATILANKVAPGLLDRYLARTGYESQQSDIPLTEERQHNLYDPVPGDQGAHGIFGRRAHRRSIGWWASRRRSWLMGAAAAGAAAVWLANGGAEEGG